MLKFELMTSVSLPVLLRVPVLALSKTATPPQQVLAQVIWALLLPSLQLPLLVTV